MIKDWGICPSYLRDPENPRDKTTPVFWKEPWNIRKITSSNTIQTLDKRLHRSKKGAYIFSYFLDQRDLILLRLHTSRNPWKFEFNISNYCNWPRSHGGRTSQPTTLRIINAVGRRLGSLVVPINSVAVINFKKVGLLLCDELRQKLQTIHSNHYSMRSANTIQKNIDHLSG